MDQQQERQVEQQLRQNWQETRRRIFDQFVQVRASDLDPATSVRDLIERIADRSHHSERYVENRLQELAGAAVAGQNGTFSDRFSANRGGDRDQSSGSDQ